MSENSTQSVKEELLAAMSSVASQTARASANTIGNYGLALSGLATAYAVLNGHSVPVTISQDR